MTLGELENPVTKERITIKQHGSEALLFEVRVPPGMIRPPLHLHRGQQESFEVLQGRVTVRTGREQVPLEPGGRLAVPPGTPHTWWNSGDDEASARSWGMYLAGPPVILQRALFATLGPIARLRGYRASYERFSAS